MATGNLIGVTAATGQLGRRVAARLAAAGAPHRLVVRDPARLVDAGAAQVATASYEDGDAMAAALAGVDTLFLVSATESADRIALHTNAVDAAVRAGVRRIVYTSFLGAGPGCEFTFARDHWRTEEHIRAAGLAHVFLRDSLYLDVLPHFVGADGLIRGPAGDGLFAPVSRDDVADVAVVALRGDQGADTYDLTGPRLITMAEVAETLAAVAGRPVGYRAETLDEAYESRSSYGAPRWEVAGWVTSYSAIAVGELAVVSSAVPDLAGHPAQSVAEFLRANPAAWAHLRGGQPA